MSTVVYSVKRGIIGITDNVEFFIVYRIQQGNFIAIFM